MKQAIIQIGKLRRRIFSVFIIVLVLMGYNAVYVQSGKITAAKPTIVNFKEIGNSLENPYMGWVDYAENVKNRVVGGNLVFARVSWMDLEPHNDCFTFSQFEEDINYNYWVSKGYKFIFLIYLDWPDPNGAIQDLPQWVLEGIGYSGTNYTTSSGSQGFSPNYGNSFMISQHADLIRKFAERYDNKNTFCVLMGSVGHWGELHTTFLKDRNSAGFYPDSNTEAQYLQPYCDYFKNVYLSLRRPRSIGAIYSTGLHNHGFGDPSQTYDWYLEYINNGYTDNQSGGWSQGMPEFWRTAPSGAEFLNWPGDAYISDQTIGATIQQAKDTHLSWLMTLPANVMKGNSRLEQNADKLLRNMGYRLVLNKAEFPSSVTRAGGKLTVKMNWTNTGIAPCYFNWPMEIAICDRDGKPIVLNKTDVNLKEWQPGKKDVTVTTNIPYWLNSGKYDLTVAFLNPDSGKPGIKLAMNASNKDLRYQLGQFTLTGN